VCVCVCVVHGATAQHWAVAPFSSGCEACDVLRGGFVCLSTNPQTGGLNLCIYDPPEIGWPRYTPRHWISRDLASATSLTHYNFEPLRSKYNHNCVEWFHMTRDREGLFCFF
jgi:hypothetical protein